MFNLSFLMTTLKKKIPGAATEIRCYLLNLKFYYNKISFLIFMQKTWNLNI